MDLTIYEHIFPVELNETLKRRNVGLLGTSDKNANRFGARLTRDGADVDVTGCKVYGYFIRPDEDTVLIEGTVEGNLVYVDIPADCYLYDGAFVLSVKISKAEDDFEQTVLIFDGILAKTATDAVVVGEYKILSVAEIAAMMAAVDDSVKQANTAAQEIRTAAENGEFDGKDGIGVSGVSVTGGPDEYGYYYTIIEYSDGNIQYIPYKVSDRAVDFLAAKGMDDPLSVTIIEETTASVDATDNSECFTGQNIVVNKDTYKLGKDAVLALESKSLAGNGSVIWNGWTNVGSSVGNSMLSGKIKVRYADDPVYMAMKLPSESVHPTVSERVNGSILYYQPSGYTNLINIGAIYAPDASVLPDTFTVCLGKMAVYTLSNAPNAKWKLHEQFNVPPGFALYQLPWTSSDDTKYFISESNITTYDTHIKFQLSKSDLDNKCLHFYGSNSFAIDIPNCKAIVCMFEAWTETDGAADKLFAAIGADQRGGGAVRQAFSGRNWNLMTEKRTVIGHNISDALYDELRETQNDPRILLENFGGIDHDARFANVLDAHNKNTIAHADIRNDIQVVEDMVLGISRETALPLNLCDEVYERGSLSSSAGTTVAGDNAVRTKNYLPVQGGRTIEAAYGTNPFNKDTTMLICQYNGTTFITSSRLKCQDSGASQPATLTLESNTTNIKFFLWLSSSTTSIDNVQITISYIENNVTSYISRSITERMIDAGKVVLTSPNGTLYGLSVDDAGTLQVIRF